jgi:hypothetical protein
MNKGFQGIETFFYFAIPTHFRHKAVLSPLFNNGIKTKKQPISAA